MIFRRIIRLKKTGLFTPWYIIQRHYKFLYCTNNPINTIDFSVDLLSRLFSGTGYCKLVVIIFWLSPTEYSLWNLGSSSKYNNLTGYRIEFQYSQKCISGSDYSRNEIMRELGYCSAIGSAGETGLSEVIVATWDLCWKY